MLRNFFAAPDFLGLLRFWERSRIGDGIADWNGEPSQIPAPLLPNIVILDELQNPRYRYVGSECARRFGDDTVGRTVAAVLKGAYREYIRSIIDDTMRRRAPVFSASVLQVETEIIIAGRLFAPFPSHRAAEPSIIASAHFFTDSRFLLREIGGSGSVLETERLLIAKVPEVCARLEEARRYHHLSGVTPDRALASEWDKIASELGKRALMPLETFHGSGEMEMGARL
jgi:hypothetical protein